VAGRERSTVVTDAELAAEIAGAMEDAAAVRQRAEDLLDATDPMGTPGQWALEAAIGGLTCVRAALADAAEEVRRGATR
jgi:hypothetical protein